MSDDIDIFLSYARGDYERAPPSARLLFQALESQGWRVFWDRRLKSGENIYKVVPARILESGCVVVAWSKDAIDSDWVLGEADSGRQLGKLLPVLLDRIVPPMPFGGYHANDLSDWTGDVEHDQFALLLEAVSEKVGPPPAPPAAEEVEPEPVSTGGEYLFPGVYIEEIPSGLSALKPASTSTAAFLGHTPRGMTTTPTFVTSFAAYQELFEDGVPDGKHGANPDGEATRRAVRAFFDNGGAHAYIVRLDATGADAYASALAAIEDIRNVNLLLLPGISWTSPAAQTDSESVDDPRSLVRLALEHCERGGDRMLLVDPPAGLELRTQADVTALDLPRSPFAVLYYPWLETGDGSERQSVPPSACAAGIWARSDAEHGVWKAPAGRQTSLHDGYIPQYAIQDTEQEALNPLGVNAIRQFDSNAPVLYGARTLAPPGDTQWRYLSIRRTVIFISKSIDEATQWTVFEPNAPALWSSLKRSIDAFMNSLWRMGAFPGRTPDEAWFVRCGLGETMTQHDIEEGRLIFEIGVAVIKPSEFVVVKFSRSQP